MNFGNRNMKIITIIVWAIVVYLIIEFLWGSPSSSLSSTYFVLIVVAGLLVYFYTRRPEELGMKSEGNKRIYRHLLGYEMAWYRKHVALLPLFLVLLYIMLRGSFGVLEGLFFILYGLLFLHGTRKRSSFVTDLPLYRWYRLQEKEILARRVFYFFSLMSIALGLAMIVFSLGLF